MQYGDEESEEFYYSHDHEDREFCLSPQLEEALLEDDFSFDGLHDQEQEVDNFQHSHEYVEYPRETMGIDKSRFLKISQQKQSRKPETIFLVQDAKTNWGEPTRPRYSEEDDKVSEVKKPAVAAS